jgi:hypothetical protein
MKADTLMPPTPASADDGDTTQARRAPRGERQDFGRALDRATPVEGPREADLEGEQAAADRDKPRDGKREEQASAVAAVAPAGAPVPATLPSAAWVYQPSAAATPPPPEPVDDDAPPKGSDGRRVRQSLREAPTAAVGPRVAEPTGERRPELLEGKGPTGPAAAGEPGPLPPERSLPERHPLEQAAADVQAQVGVLARAAHILVGCDGARGLELHLRVRGDRSELRAAGPLTPVIRARLAELELALAAQGLPLVSFEETERSAAPGDSDPEPPGREGKRDGVSKVRAIKA